MREQWFKPLGLITEPNKLGLYPVGAMSRADNLVMRAPGLLMSIDQPAVLPGSMSSIAAVVHRAVTTGDQLIAWAKTATGWDVWWQTLAGVTVMPFADTATPVTFAADGRISSSLFRRRTVFNSEIGPWVVDYTNPTTTAERTARWAGLPQPIMAADRVLPDGLAVKRNHVVTYAATLERRYSGEDDYVLISEPSPLVRVKASDTADPDADPETIFSVDLGIGFGGNNVGRHGVRAGDLLKIWRSPEVPSDGFDLNTESGTTLYLAKTIVLTQAQCNFGFVSTIDDAEPRSLTEELYTNPGQEGLDGARRRPPHSKTIASYQGYTFYGNCTTPGRWQARLPYGFGALPNGDAIVRQRGIGVRGFVGSVAAGATSITGVSAADYEGLAVGQLVHSGSSASYITALPGGGVLTISPAATSAATGLMLSVDTVEVDGRVLLIGDLRQLLGQITQYSSTVPKVFYSVTTSETVAYREVETNIAPDVYGGLQLTFNQTFSIEPYRFVQNGGSISVRATNGQNYDPPVPDMSQPAQVFAPKVEKNLAYWSWDQQPECVAPPNYTPVGAGEIYQCIRAGDTLYFFCSDGLHRLSGYGTRSSGIGAQWRVDAVDRTLILLAPWLTCTLRDSVYAHTNRGLVELGPDGVRAELSAGVVGDLLRPAGHFTAEPFRTMAADDLNHEVWIQQGAPGSSLIYIYNTYQQAFTQTLRPASNCLVYADFLDAMAFAQSGAGARPTLLYYRGLAATTYENIVVDFQPTSGNDPLHAKQWIDMTLVFAEVTGGAGVTARWNGVAGAARTRAQRPNDARANYGVPRSAPAVAATLSPGYQFSGSSLQLVLRAVSLRYEPLSEQYLHR